MAVTPELQATLLSYLPDVVLSYSGSSHLEPLAVEDEETLDWSVSAILDITPDDDDDDDRKSVEWTAAEGVSLDRASLRIWSMSGFTADTFRIGASLRDALDARSMDSAAFSPLVNLGTGELLTAIDDEYNPMGSNLVIIERVRLAPAWRGLGGVGRLLTASALRWIARETKVVAVHPYPIDLGNAPSDDPRFPDAMAAVRRTWGSLGFEPMDGHEDIWLLDPAMNAMNEAEEELRGRLLGPLSTDATRFDPAAPA